MTTYSILGIEYGYANKEAIRAAAKADWTCENVDIVNANGNGRLGDLEACGAVNAGDVDVCLQCHIGGKPHGSTSAGKLRRASVKTRARRSSGTAS